MRNEEIGQRVAGSEDAPQSSEHAPRLPTTGPKSIAFYLPQFHPTPENDAFWGTGFTEWSSVVQARPQFPGHYQPRIPADLGFYDLRLPEARQAQVDLAREHGVHGFCYYHYWSEGRRVLERPLDEVLASGKPDFPFCLCWANHDWSWRRSNKERGRLVPQNYSEEDDREHIRWLLGVFEDERYIRVDGRPLLLVYSVQALPDPGRTMSVWREEARKAGVAEPYICKMDTFGDFAPPEEVGCDAAVEFWPHKLDTLIGQMPPPEGLLESSRIFAYKAVVDALLERPAPRFRRYPTVVPHWDNTPRNPTGRQTILHGSTPELYEKWLEGALGKVSSNPPGERLVFVNAWNEWAESAYLEPDLKYGRAYLEATKRATEAAGVEIPADNLSEGAPPSASIEELYRDLQKKYARLQELNVELLNAEELSPLVLQKEKKIDKLRKALRRLQRQGGRLREQETSNGQAESREMRELIGWMRRVDADLSDLLGSRRWKMSDALGKTGRRVLRKPGAPTAEERLSRVLDEFRSWLKKSGR